jgi:hypothetical protein
MTPEQIKETVENFPKLLRQQENLKSRLIKCSGRDPEQEVLILMRLEPIEKAVELIDKAAYESELLTIREECCLIQRMEGKTPKEIADCFSVTTNTVYNLLNKAYKKIAESLQVS